MDSNTPNAPVTVPALKAKPTTSAFKLTVKFAFADYQVGQVITDPEEVESVLAGECAGNVLKTAA
jgi:hypothetical protein